MDEFTTQPEWALNEWEQALTIHVGTAYVCRQCDNLVMVTKGGTGVMEMTCCGKPMERLLPSVEGSAGRTKR
jgi:hypothetical protein